MKRLYIIALFFTVSAGAHAQDKKPQEKLIHISMDMSGKDIEALSANVNNLIPTLKNSDLPSWATTQLEGILTYFNNNCVSAYRTALDTAKKTTGKVPADKSKTKK